jgi:hypothetical protein
MQTAIAENSRTALDQNEYERKQGALVEEFDEGLWSSLVQEVVVNDKDDIRFIFKNGFEIKTR